MIEKIINQILNFFRWFLSGRESHFNDVDQKISFMQSLPDPERNIDRCFCQYQCQTHFNPVRTLLDNFLALPIAIALYVYAWISKDTNIVKKPAKTVAIMDCDIKFIPNSACAPEKAIEQFGIAGPIHFDSIALDLLSEITSKHWQRPYLLAKCFLKIGRYSHLVVTSSCTKIICSTEYSFTSSILTEYCERCGIEHVNVMHGEKLLNIIDAFSTFHLHYVWDEHFARLFNKLRSGTARYVVDMPPALLVPNTSSCDHKFKLFDFTYYLGWELQKQDLLTIAINMQLLAKEGVKVCIRKHPVYGQSSEIEQLFTAFEIEDPSRISIAESLSRTRAAISLYSTVFWQADAAGVSVVLDDASNEEYYEKLLRMNFVWIGKTSKRLSKVLGGSV